jgi:hypothetical protein
MTFSHLPRNTFKYTGFVQLCKCANIEIKRMEVIISGYLDGLRESFDNEKPIRVLYEKK